MPSPGSVIGQGPAQEEWNLGGKAEDPEGAAWWRLWLFTAFAAGQWASLEVGLEDHIPESPTIPESKQEAWGRGPGRKTHVAGSRTPGCLESGPEGLDVGQEASDTMRDLPGASLLSGSWCGTPRPHGKSEALVPAELTVPTTFEVTQAHSIPLCFYLVDFWLSFVSPCGFLCSEECAGHRA